MGFWTGRRVLVAGGSGFIGSHLVERLLVEGAAVRVTGRSRSRLEEAIGSDQAKYVEFFEGDLIDASFSGSACRGMEAVFNLSAVVAGIEYNNAHPGTMFIRNLTPILNVLDAAVQEGIERYLCVSSACVYRRECVVPTPESEGFLEDPESTVFGYGWAKRVQEVQARCYAKEFPIKIGIARPYNAYGPRDDFKWETSHVIPALIRKTVEGHDPIIVWGDGRQTRSFLYVNDFVEGLLLTLEKYPECDPVNIGTDEEVTVADLIQMIVELSNNNPKIVFDASKPTGQTRRNGDFSKAKEKLGFEPKVTLKEGLAHTMEWFKNNQKWRLGL